MNNLVIPTTFLNPIAMQDVRLLYDEKAYYYTGVYYDDCMNTRDARPRTQLISVQSEIDSFRRPG